MVIGTLAVDGWAVTFWYTARRGLGSCSAANSSAPSCVIAKNSALALSACMQQSCLLNSTQVYLWHTSIALVRSKHGRMFTCCFYRQVFPGFGVRSPCKPGDKSWSQKNYRLWATCQCKLRTWSYGYGQLLHCFGIYTGFQLNFKLSTVTFKALQGRPPYLASLLDNTALLEPCVLPPLN